MIFLIPIFSMLLHFFRFSFLFVVILTGCKQTSSSLTFSNWQFIAGRDDGQSTKRPLLYRAYVPSQWIRQDPSSTTSIADTTLANCEFYIHDHDQTIRLTVHTFPITQNQLRIPPQAQIVRWKRQLEDLDLLSSQILPDSHGGFSGLYFEGQGLLEGQPTKIMGWSMQLASSYDRQLKLANQPFDHYKRADYTIKASGSPEFMHKHRLEILVFARSFELIDELPSPL